MFGFLVELIQRRLNFVLLCVGWQCSFWFNLNTTYLLFIVYVTMFCLRPWSDIPMLLLASCSYIINEMRGPESTIEAYHIRVCTGYTIQTFLCVLRLVASIGDLELHSLLAGDAECHQLYKWPTSPLGVCHYW